MALRGCRVRGCRVRGPGRIWVERTETEPLENITLAEIDWDVTGPVPETPEPKPLGSARVIVEPDRPAYEARRSHLVAVHVNDLHVQDLRLHGADGGRKRNAGD